MDGNNQRVGLLIMTAVALIVGGVLLAASAQQVGTATNTITVTNKTIAAPADGGVYYINEAQEYLGGLVVFNASGFEIYNSSVYTMAENISPVTGVKTVYLLDGGYRPLKDVAQNLKVSYTYGEQGYIDDAGGRAIASVIIILFALAIAVVALYPTLRERFS